MNNAARPQREIGAPMEAVEHVDYRQAMDRGLGVRPEFNRAGSAPAFVDDDVGEAPGGKLADGGPAVEMVDRLQVDVLGKIEMPAEAGDLVGALLVGHGTGDDVDAVPRDGPDDEIAAVLEFGLAQLFRLAMHLATVRHADV